MKAVENVSDFLNDNPVVGIAFAVGWVTIAIGLSVVLRRLRGKPILTPRLPEAIFWEGHASGHPGGWRALGAASNVLQVAVTTNTVVIRPMFPFNLMFMPEVWGLEATVHQKDVLAITLELDARARPTVTMKFRKPGGGEQTLFLHLKDPKGFVGSVRRPQT